MSLHIILIVSMYPNLPDMTGACGIQPPELPCSIVSYPAHERK